MADAAEPATTARGGFCNGRLWSSTAVALHDDVTRVLPRRHLGVDVDPVDITLEGLFRRRPVAALMSGWVSYSDVAERWLPKFIVCRREIRRDSCKTGQCGSTINSSSQSEGPRVEKP